MFNSIGVVLVCMCMFVFYVSVCFIIIFLMVIFNFTHVLYILNASVSVIFVTNRQTHQAYRLFELFPLSIIL